MQKVRPDAKGIVKKVCLPKVGLFCVLFFQQKGAHFLLEKVMENRVALIGIVVNNENSVEPLNKILHDYKDFIVGRMGIPYRNRGINIISVVIDAPNDCISALTGRIGMIDGVTAKALYSKV